MIALDAMGGDFAPEVTVHGAIKAAQRGIAIALFGDQDLLHSLLDKAYTGWRTLPLHIHHCTQVISMGEEPSRSVVKKNDASLVRAVRFVADGQAVAVVSAGNSGAALVAGTLIIGRVDGVMRPALGNFLPTPRGSLFCIDLGATTDCKPEYLEQFAVMGHLFVQKMMGIAAPRVALLSNGAEAYKGSLIVKQAYALLDENKQLHFVGNVEARDIFLGHADVLVCDGFTGNIMLKTAQGTVKAVTAWLKDEAAQSWRHKIILGLAGGLFKRLQQKTDYVSRGGALLLGVHKPLIVTHGCSNAEAIEHAIMYAHSIAKDNFLHTYNQSLQYMLSPVVSTSIPSLHKEQDAVDQ
jgi:glycerol-3-phosphate acyltransferase PlsX